MNYTEYKYLRKKVINWLRKHRHKSCITESTSHDDTKRYYVLRLYYIIVY